MRDIDRVLLSREEILAGIDRLAEQINRDYAGKELTMVGILKGSILFYAELLLRIKLPVRMDFMSISSYGQSSRSSGVVRILKDLDRDIVGANAIIVEDIIDSGMSMSLLKDSLIGRGAKLLKICTLLDKPSRRRIQIQADYCGFEIPDEFVVGYGLDYNEHYRELPDIGVLKPEVYQNGDGD
jgi:hypoxanthine phosphoribosyltransferase